MRKTLFPHLNIRNQNNRAFKVYDRVFEIGVEPFTQGYAQARDRAFEEATQYALQRLAVLEGQSGAPLDNRAEIRGYVEQPEEKLSGSLKQIAADPDRSPFASRIAALERQLSSHVPTIRGHAERSLAALRQRDAKFQEKRAAEVAAETRRTEQEANEDWRRARAHAIARMDDAKNSPTSTQEERDRAAAGLAFILSPEGRSGEYWSTYCGQAQPGTPTVNEVPNADGE